jgi:PPP family 3-phenylpropionic acid transporter
LGALLKNRSLVIFFLLVTLIQVGKAPVGSFFPLYLVEVGGTTSHLGAAYGVQGISELPLWLMSGWIIQRLGVLRTMVVGALVFALRAFLYSVVTDPLLAVAIQISHGALALLMVASIEYVNQQVPPTWRATGQSVLSAVNMGLGALLGNLVGGFLYDYVGLQSMYRWSSALILVVAVVILVGLGRKGTPARSEEPGTRMALDEEA